MCGSEVQVISGAAGKSVADGRGFVGGIVVHQVHRASRWQVGVQMVEKFLELPRTMTSKTFSDDIAGGDVQGRETGTWSHAAGNHESGARPVPVASERPVGRFNA
jgi:hypothetical protein